MKTKMDMLNGNLWKNVLLFSLPIAFSMILQQLFNAADVAIAGKFAGDNALAAVGSNSPVISLFVNTIAGFSIGANVLVAKYIGQKREDAVSKSVCTIVLSSVGIGLLFFAISYIFAGKLLTLIDTPTEVLPEAMVYLRIYLIGLPFTVVYNFGTAILRSIGDTKRPLVVLMISGIINVALNLIFVIRFQMGVAGVATATVISTILSTSCIIIFLLKEKGAVKLNINPNLFSFSILKEMFRIGIPSAIQSMVFSASNVILQSGINSFGSSAIAGSSAGLNYEYFTYFMAASFNQAASTFTGQNFGSGNLKRCKKIFWVCMIEGMVCTAVLIGIFVVKLDWWVSLYTANAEVAEYAKNRIMHVTLLEYLVCTYEISGACMRSMGYSIIPAVLTIIGSVCFRILWLFTIFKMSHTFTTLVIVYPVSWVFTGIMMLFAFILVWKKIRQKTFIKI